jgi:hypothetical protein
MYTRYKIVEFFSNFFAIVIEFAPKKKQNFPNFLVKNITIFFHPKKIAHNTGLHIMDCLCRYY